MTREIGRKIGKVFVEVHEAIVPQVGSKVGKHIKVLVTLDVSQPLLRGTMVKMGDNRIWVDFEYERCPDFCYLCGIIGHNEKSCFTKNKPGANRDSAQFGAWMLANSGKIIEQKMERTNILGTLEEQLGYRDLEQIQNRKLSQRQSSFIPERNVQE